MVGLRILRPGRVRVWRLSFSSLMLGAGSLTLSAQTVLLGFDPAEQAGERPYEMVWAGRNEAGSPTVRFGALTD